MDEVSHRHSHDGARDVENGTPPLGARPSQSQPDDTDLLPPISPSKSKGMHVCICICMCVVRLSVIVSSVSLPRFVHLYSTLLYSTLPVPLCLVSHHVIFYSPPFFDPLTVCRMGMEGDPSRLCCRTWILWRYHDCRISAR
jgi:hypothetical protein